MCFIDIYFMSMKLYVLIFYIWNLVWIYRTFSLSGCHWNIKNPGKFYLCPMKLYVLIFYMKLSMDI
jgi:hypothetical protein